jgi:hypothetical protein
VTNQIPGEREMDITAFFSAEKGEREIMRGEDWLILERMKIQHLEKHFGIMAVEKINFYRAGYLGAKGMGIRARYSLC